MSILSDTKRALGVSPTDTAFDVELIMYINGAFSVLNQIGAGPINGYMLNDGEEAWSSFFDDVRLNFIKPIIYLRVRLLFDPPETAHAINAIKDQLAEYEYRLNTAVEHRDAGSTTTVIVVDGGGV